MALQQNGRRLTAATTENSDEIFYTTPVSAFSHLLGLVPLSVPTFPKSFIRPQNRGAILQTIFLHLWQIPFMIQAV